ncbi:hypothetical protein CFP56_000277 [Quercus suber]|uniref:Uncharacterized protein n=1 Tax=Quercus suber TaxID=58331 RepID=A0AAW0MCH3_QUESU
MTKEWIALKPEGCVVGDSIGLAFYPFGYSLNTRPIFKLVSIQQSKVDPHLYSFAVYSQTSSWTTSKEMFNWLTQNHHILSFDVKREISKVIKLPGEASSSLTQDISIIVWMLKDYASSEWVLKYQVTLVDICQESYADLTHCNETAAALLYIYATRFNFSNPTVIPYSISLASAGVFKEDQSDENKSSED